MATITFPQIFSVIFFILATITSSISVSAAAGNLILEDGYTVSTLIDGHKLNINPFSVHPRPGSADLVVLDSPGSAFYTVSFPLSGQESVVKRWSGNGEGFVDGELGLARFARPRSFAVDLMGNVYVADRKNNAIRKISSSGVSTIAGGISKKTGSVDGPAQNASFSSDFELLFVPERCALLISDHGNQLVRQINLKLEDCLRSSPSGVMGMASLWILGLGASCFLGLVAGFAARPYVLPNEGSSQVCPSKTWKHYLIKLGSRALTPFFVIKSAIASLMLYTFLRNLLLLSVSHLSLIFRACTNETKNPSKKSVSMLDGAELTARYVGKPQICAEQLTDLISFAEDMDLTNSMEVDLKSVDENQKTDDAPSESNGRIDRMIQANISGLVMQAEKADPPGWSELNSLGLVKRRQVVVENPCRMSFN